MKHLLYFLMPSLVSALGADNSSKKNDDKDESIGQFFLQNPELMLAVIVLGCTAIVGIYAGMLYACERVKKHCNSSHTAEREPLRSRPVQ